MAERRLISIVTPCFNEELNVIPCYEAVRAVFEGELARYDYEHIFCDNASTDRTATLLRELAARDRRVRVILNARNFGPYRSTFNGLMSTRGAGVLAELPCDLQDPPELLPELVRRWEQNNQVVAGVRTRREESWIMRSVRHLYYRVVNRFAEFPVRPDVGEFQFIDRCVVEALRKFDDHYPYTRGMIASCGFTVATVDYTWRARKRGFSKNSLYNLIDQGLNGIISFSKVPMRLMMLAGLAIATLSILRALYDLVMNLLFYRELAAPGIATLIVGLFFFNGVILFLLGLMGEYISAIHFQVRRRPLVIERERINFEEG